MSWADDTDWILTNESGSIVVTVYSASIYHTSTSVIPTQSNTVIETATVYLFPRKGMLKKDDRGNIIDQLDMILFPNTSDVSVTHRIYKSGSSNYFEVERVDSRLGHKEVHAKLVKGRL